MAIKILLLAGVLLVALVAYRGARSATHTALWRLAGLVVVTAMAVGVVYPDGITHLARAVGVGRGTDLVLYVTVICFVLVSLLVFRRLAEVESRYVRLARRHAIAEARLRYVDTAPGSRERAPGDEEP